ncbi:MAG TPA: hypothetical protein VJN69_14475 [Candidatus Acidoferrales bacterium]|nr:hypothetical protein [Candidatus Acidoferrales bacterium]
MKKPERIIAANIASNGSVLDIDLRPLAPAGTVTGLLYPNQFGHEDTERYRPALITEKGAVTDLDGRELAPAGTIAFE